MKSFKTVFILLFLILLLAACGKAPASDAGNPEDAVGLYSGPYEDILPMSVPEISEADKTTFNPDKIFDYLATCVSAGHEYAITGWKAEGDKLSLNISDRLYFDIPSEAFYYIKEAFALDDSTLLRLSVFSKCRVEEDQLTEDSSLDFSGYKEKVFDSVPVADDATIFLSGDYSEISTVQEFIDNFIDGKYKDAGSIPSVTFDYENGKITGISPVGLYDGNNEGGGSEDVVKSYPEETISPHSFGFGSLPVDLLGIKPISTDSFDSYNAENYLLANKTGFEDYYFVNKAKLENGKLNLYLTDSVSIDADTAYQYLKKTFSLSDNDILDLFMFSENGCTLHDGKMYTPDEWDIKNGIQPEYYDEDYNYNSIVLGDITLPKPVTVADNAVIILFNYSENGGTITTKQFEDYLLGENGEDNLEYLNNLWFKYSNNEITALVEEYTP